MELTLLKCAPKLVLAKAWMADGTVAPAAKAAWFSAQELCLKGLPGFLTVLREIERDPRVAIVKEAVAASANPCRLRRRCEAGCDPRTGEQYPAGLRVVPRSWLALDVEKLDRPSAIPFDDGPKMARYVRDLLPEFLRSASCVWQFSGSSGHPRTRGEIRMHLFIELDDAIAPEAWKLSFRQFPFVDASVFDKAKLIFTAAPLPESGEDPIKLRSGFLNGRSFASVPEDVRARSLRILKGETVGRRVAPVAPAPMKQAAKAFIEIISASNILRSHHASYQNDRSRRLAFCRMLKSSFGIEDDDALEQAFHIVCVGGGDPHADHDARQSVEWAGTALITERTFSTRKLCCDAAAALHQAGDKEAATRAARLAMYFWQVETGEGL